MVAMPIFVLYNIIDVVFVIGSQAESAVFPLALVIHRLYLALLAFALLLASLIGP
jgi:hypothetical protein